jgi:hypothetical protein
MRQTPPDGIIEDRGEADPTNGHIDRRPAGQGHVLGPVDGSEDLRRELLVVLS